MRIVLEIVLSVYELPPSLMTWTRPQAKSGPKKTANKANNTHRGISGNEVARWKSITY